MKNLTISRKGHTRMAYVANRGGKKVQVSKARVKPSVYKSRDRGKLGRGPKVVPPLKKGALGGPGFFDRSSEAQEQIAFERAGKLGERKA